MSKIVAFIEQIPNAVKHVTDIGAIGVAWGAFFTNVVPAIAAMLSVIWLSLQIYSYIVNKKWKNK